MIEGVSEGELLGDGKDVGVTDCEDDAQGTPSWLAADTIASKCTISTRCRPATTSRAPTTPIDRANSPDVDPSGSFE